MNLEDAIKNANDIMAKIRSEGQDAVSDEAVRDAMEALRVASTASTTKRKTTTSAPVDLEAMFG
jgi:hypothetical protein